MNPLFKLSGTVIEGQKRGKVLGFPTANLHADTSLPKGTYISETVYMEKKYPSVTFIGTVDTFNETDFVAETYIIWFDKDIYGEEIKVEVLKKLRDNQKFESVEKLIEQMKKDEVDTKAYFSSLLTN